MPIVDAHPHIYSPDRDSYPTIATPWEPGEPAAAEDLKKQMDAVGVDRAVFIQTGTFYGHDNRYIIDSAKRHAEWACGVVTLDPDDAAHLDILESAVSDSNVRGLRGTADSINRLATPNVFRLWRKAMELRIPVNCMVMDDLDRVPEIELMARELGDLKIVIDHCFMLNTRQHTEETLQALERLARLPNVYAKLTSGTHGSYRVYPYPDMHDPLKRVIEAFGPNRCVWGSNFPNALWSKGASYSQNLHLFVKELGLSLPEKADILGLTAMALWFPKQHAAEKDDARKQKERTERESAKAQQAEEPDEDEQQSENNGHRAEILKMADLIAAEGRVEGPILEEVDDIEISGILDAAQGLNATLDIEAPKKTAKAAKRSAKKKKLAAVDSASEPDEPVESDKAEAKLDQVVDAPATTETDAASVADDVQAQIDAAFSSADVQPEVDIEALNPSQSSVADELESVTSSDIDETPDSAAEADILDIDPEESVSIDVEQLLASQNYDPIDVEGLAGSEHGVDADPPEFNPTEKIARDLDLNDIQDVADQLNAMLEAVEGISGNIADLTADLDTSDDESGDDAAEGKDRDSA